MVNLESLSTGELGSLFIKDFLSQNFSSTEKILKILYSRPYEAKEEIYKNIRGQLDSKKINGPKSEVSVYEKMADQFLAFALG